MSLPKNVVFVPSGATISGLSARGSRVGAPATVNRIGVVPAEENDSSSGGETPNAGVLKNGAAPTASAPAALAWPKRVPLLVANVFTTKFDRKATYFSMLGSGPATRPMAILAWVGGPPLVTPRMSTGSPPTLATDVLKRKVPVVVKSAMSRSVWAPGAPLTEKNGSDHCKEICVVPLGKVTV